MQRCQAQPRTFAIAAFKPECASRMASWTPTQAALDQASEKRCPEGVGLGLADVDGQDLAPTGFVDAVRDHQGLVHDSSAVSDLLDLGVQEHYG